MSKREETLQALREIALELPDEDLRKLESFASYLKRIKRERTDDPLLDLIIGSFRHFAEEKGAVLYGIAFRNAGVGIQWFEEKRSGERPSPVDSFVGNVVESLAEYNRAISEWYKRGVVIYKYYETLSEAIAGEWRRLEEMDLPSREEDLANHG